MNTTEIKTRHGLILQALTAKAIEQTGYTFVENHQYDEVSEVPDFLIPNADNPWFMVEVHQTDTRNSFQMKTLRGFTAVTESKVHYTDDLVSVNILFGDPANEVPESNLKALCGYFDLNILPRYAADDRTAIEELEAVSLRFAATDDLSVSDGASQTAEECPGGLDELAKTLGKLLKTSAANSELKNLWRFERKRTRQLGLPPGPGERTYYKRNILRSLFFTDPQFEELIIKNNSADYSQKLSKQLVRCKLAIWEEQIWGDELVVNTEFADFLKDPDATRLRELCQKRLSKNEAMRWFFEDIRDATRRLEMCKYVFNLLRKGQLNAADVIYSDIRNTQKFKIRHRRCWIADLLPLIVDKSHNYFNRLIFQHNDYSINLGNPFNNIAIKSERLGTDPKAHRVFANVAIDVFFNELSLSGKEVLEISIEELADKLLQFRTGAAIKLQKLNPLYLLLESICQLTGLSFSYKGTKSIISDLVGTALSVGKFDLFHITDGQKTVIANAVTVKDQNGDHKSKEWGARRRSRGISLKIWQGPARRVR